MKRLSFLGVLFLSTTVWSWACIGVVDAECKPSKPCVCDGIGVCELECPAEGCDFQCGGIGVCEFSCPDGGCDALCDGSGSCELDCPGGDCSLTCEGTGTCELTGCTSAEGCQTNCNGVGVCTGP